MNTKTLLFAGIALFSLAAAAPDAVVLRRELKEATLESYKLQSEVKQKADVPTMGEQDLDAVTTMSVKLKSGKLDAATNQVSLDATISDIQMKSSGSIAEMADQMTSGMPKEFKMTGKLDSRNRISVDQTKAPDLMMIMFTGTSPSSSLMFVEFPEKAVNVGDSWTFPAPKNPLFGTEVQNLTAKLTGEKELNGTKAWAVSVNGKLNINADLGKLIKESGSAPTGMPDMAMIMKGTAEMSGEALIDKATGKTLQYVVNVTQKTKTEMESFGTVESSGTIKTTLTLQKS
jgi:hypothetical protein